MKITRVRYISWGQCFKLYAFPPLISIVLNVLIIKFIIVDDIANYEFLFAITYPVSLLGMMYIIIYGVSIIRTILLYIVFNIITTIFTSAILLMLLYIMHGDDLKLRDVDNAAQDLLYYIPGYESESEDNENLEEDDSEFES